MGHDVTSLGSVVFLGFASVAAEGYLLIAGKRRYAVLVAATVADGEPSAHFPKPPLSAKGLTSCTPHGFSPRTFPVAMFSAVTFLSLGVLSAQANPNPQVKTYFVLLAVFLTVMVGLSRIYLGVHYPTEVLAGWCVGAAWAILCWSAIQWIENRSG